MLLDKDARILVVGAHPDDDVLGCGGTLARAIELGAEVSVMFLGEGVSARFDDSDLDSPKFHEAMETRTQGALNALKLLGITNYEFGTNYCCRFDTIPILTLVKSVEAKIREFQPTIVLSHNPAEVNIDHRTTYKVVESAARPDINSPIHTILGFEIVCSGNLGYGETFEPDLYVDIKSHWNQKIAAWNCYVDEEKPFPFPRSVEGLKTLAKYRGMQSGLELAEGFRIYRSILRY